MPNYNRLILMGHLARDISFKNIPSGKLVGESAICVNNGYGDNKKPCFIDFAVWEKKAEALQKSGLGKGDAILLDGRLEQENWETKEGQKRSKHKMAVMDFSFVGSKGNQEGAPQASAGDDEPPF